MSSEDERSSGSQHGTRRPPRGDFGNYAALLGVGITVFAGVLYVFLTLICNWVYSPLGISSEDVGLTYQALLLRGALALTGAGLILTTAAFAVVYVLLFARMIIRVITSGLRNRGRFSRAKPSLLPSRSARPGWTIWLGFIVVYGGWILLIVGDYGFLVTLIVATCVGAAVLWTMWGAGRLMLSSFARLLDMREETVQRIGEWLKPWGRFIAFGCVAFVFATAFAFTLLQQSISDSARLADGSVPDELAFGIRPPWDAAVVKADWANEAAPSDLALPSCLLYLGQANATSVFLDASTDDPRTLKLPTAAVLVEVLPDADSALPPPDGSKSCD